MRTFILIKTDNNNRQYISEVRQGNYYPYDMANEGKVVELPQDLNSECHITINNYSEQ